MTNPASGGLGKIFDLKTSDYLGLFHDYTRHWRKAENWLRAAGANSSQTNYDSINNKYLLNNANYLKCCLSIIISIILVVVIIIVIETLTSHTSHRFDGKVCPIFSLGKQEITARGNILDIWGRATASAIYIFWQQLKKTSENMERKCYSIISLYFRRTELVTIINLRNKGLNSKTLNYENKLPWYKLFKILPLK